MNNIENLKRPVDKSGTPQTIRLGPPNKVKGPSVMARIHAAKSVEEVDGVMGELEKMRPPAPVKALRRWVRAAANRKVEITTPKPKPEPEPKAEQAKNNKPEKKAKKSK